MDRAKRRRTQRAAASSGGGVMIGYLTPDENCAQFQINMRALEGWDRLHSGRVFERGDIVSHICGPRVAAGRNAIVQGFLVHPREPEWLLMIDADMSFPPNLVERLVEVADPDTAPLVGALCFAGGRSGEVKPTLYVLTATQPSWQFDIVWDYPQDSMCKVDATGAACLLIHRSVLEKMAAEYGDRAHPWFAETEIGTAEYGEDITFCMRARSLGYPVHVHTGIQIGHMKLQVIDQESYLTYRRGITEMGEDAWKAKELARRFVGPPV